MGTRGRYGRTSTPYTQRPCASVGTAGTPPRMICAALRRAGVMDDMRGGRYRPFVVFGAFVSAMQYYVNITAGPLRLTARRAQRLRDYVGKCRVLTPKMRGNSRFSMQKNAQNARKTTEKRPKNNRKTTKKRPKNSPYMRPSITAGDSEAAHIDAHHVDTEQPARNRYSRRHR